MLKANSVKQNNKIKKVNTSLQQYLLFPIDTKKRGKYLLNSSYLFVEHRICKCIQTFTHILCRIKGYVIHRNRYFYAILYMKFPSFVRSRKERRGVKEKKKKTQIGRRKSVNGSGEKREAKKSSVFFSSGNVGGCKKQKDVRIFYIFPPI